MTILTNEGFVDITIHYMGKLWVLLEFTSVNSKNYFMTMWVSEFPGWVPDFLEEYDDEDQSDDGSKDGDPKTHDLGSCGGDSYVEEVPDTLFEEKGQINDKLDEESTGQKMNHSVDPFGIYPLLNKKKDTTETNNNLEHSLKYPPGFTPNEDSDAFHMNVEDDRNNDYVAESVCSGHFKKSEAPCSSRSILNLMEELVKVGQTMGYNMDGCMNNMTEIIESQGATEVNFLELQETKMENMEIFSVKMCRGNFAFDYVHSDSVGVWLKTGNDLLIVAVYAPHDLKDKRMLWDYLVYEITKWHGEVVMAISVISISSDSSEDSVGTPAGRVILFGTIPTTIPDTTPVITPPATQTDTPVIPTETPIIAPTIPPSPDYTPASPDYSPASDSESDPSEDPSSDHIPPLPAISPFLSSFHSYADDSSTMILPDTDTINLTHGTHSIS
ncbi:hypothetical protein Tco_0419419 [Tanacetum coccineum]